MKQDEILYGIKLRSLFDLYCHEFQSSNNDKMRTLSILNHYGLLKKVIKEYRKKYRENERKDIVDAVKPTLLFHVKNLNPEKFWIAYSKRKMDDIIDILSSELERYFDTHNVADYIRKRNRKNC